MTLKLGVLMDRIDQIKPYKDSTFAMMLAAKEKGFDLRYFNQKDLYAEKGIAYVKSSLIDVVDQVENYYQLSDEQTHRLDDFDAILMRKDPPFDLEYIYSTYFLEMAEKNKTIIVNPPAALRTVNEKFFINYFSEVTPKTIVTKDVDLLINFIKTNHHCVVKPLDGMGGQGIFKVSDQDPNATVILETLGQQGQNTLMAQVYLDDVIYGDKRILLVDGEPVSYGLARIPTGDDFRANLAAGGIGEVQKLTKRDYEICQAVAPRVKELGLLFVGLDVIAGHLTEINVTSPTCIREIEAETGLKIAAQLMNVIEQKVLKITE